MFISPPRQIWASHCQNPLLTLPQSWPKKDGYSAQKLFSIPVESMFLDFSHASYISKKYERLMQALSIECRGRGCIYYSSACDRLICEKGSVKGCFVRLCRQVRGKCWIYISLSILFLQIKATQRVTGATLALGYRANDVFLLHSRVNAFEWLITTNEWVNLVGN